MLFQGIFVLLARVPFKYKVVKYVISLYNLGYVSENVAMNDKHTFKSCNSATGSPGATCGPHLHLMWPTGSYQNTDYIIDLSC